MIDINNSIEIKSCELTPWGDVLRILVDKDNSDKYYIAQDDNIMLSIEAYPDKYGSSWSSLSCILEYYRKVYNIHKHFLYPTMPFKIDEFEDIKKRNYEIFDEIEKKYNQVACKDGILQSAIDEYKAHKDVK